MKTTKLMVFGGQYLLEANNNNKSRSYFIYIYRNVAGTPTTIKNNKKTQYRTPKKTVTIFFSKFAVLILLILTSN